MSSAFDEILDHKIGFGKYQILALILVSLVDLNDGVQLILMPLMTPIIKIQWNLTMNEISLLTSIFYLGMCFGAFLTGKVADNYGRRISLIYSSFFQFLISFGFWYINDKYTMAIMRFFYGFIFGFSLPLTASMISEITPLKYRGKMLVTINFFMTFGKLYGCLMGFFFLKDLNHGDWNGMMAFSSLTPLTVFIFSTCYLKESPRFLLAASRYEETFDILNYMIQKNNPLTAEDLLLSQEDREKLQHFQVKTFDSQEKASIRSLFKKKYFNVTVGLWILWFSINFMYYGQLVILPFLLGDSKKGLDQMIIAILGETPALLITLFFIERPNFGRKNSLMICFFMAGLLSLLSYFLPKGNLALSFAISRFFMKECFAFLYAFTSESYGTLNRTLGYGMSSAIGRAGATVMPYVLFPFYEIDEFSCFLWFFALSMISSLACYKIKHDTMGKNLDLIEIESPMVLYEMTETETKKENEEDSYTS